MKHQKDSFWIRNKDKILVAVIFGLFTYIIWPYLYQLISPEKKEKAEQPIVIKTISQDTGIINANEITQDNRNAQSVSNTLVGRDQHIRNTNTIIKKDSTINNYGFLNSGNNNTYNQKIEGKIQRHFNNPVDQMELLKLIPKGYSVLVRCIFGDEETCIVAKEIDSLLTANNIKTEDMERSVFRSQQFGVIDVNTVDSLKSVIVTIFSQKTL